MTAKQGAITALVSRHTLRTGKRSEFVTFTAELRLTHRAKRNFMKRLDRVLARKEPAAASK